jgi:hypothetical protein
MQMTSKRAHTTNINFTFCSIGENVYESIICELKRYNDGMRGDNSSFVF